jgi:chromate transporter
VPSTHATSETSLAEIIREWGRIGCTGFGGPPAHVALFRELCVERRRWLTDEQFERALAATNLLPGPASTQLAIYCAWRVRRRTGALAGGLCFVLPGLLALIALSVLFLSASPPRWVLGAGMGAGAAVPAVALGAGLAVGAPIARRAGPAPWRTRARLLGYALAGLIGAATVGPELVLILLGCGAIELLCRHPPRARASGAILLAPPALARGAAAPLAQALRSVLLPAADQGGAAALAWTALKVGGLSFGGGFVIVPLMQSDAVESYHWLTHAQFSSAVALGQVTPGPVTHTVAAVGYGAAGLPGALLAAAIAFAPSFAFVLLGAGRFERLAADRRAQAFLAGAAPAAAGAIVGAAIPLTAALGESWQYALLAAAALSVLALRRGVVPTLLLAGLAGLCLALLGAPVGG